MGRPSIGRTYRSMCIYLVVMCDFSASSRSTCAAASDCCLPDGTFICHGSCFVGGMDGFNQIGFPKERNTLITIQNTTFVKNNVQGFNGTKKTAFKEVEVFTQVPNDCHHLTGVTFNRTDVVGSIGQVVTEDLYVNDNCSSFVKIVRGQQNPGPVLCHVNCTLESFET